jgi:predicted metal-dependent peptidase
VSLDLSATDLLAAAKLWVTSPPLPGAAPTGDMPYLSTALYALVVVATDRVATTAVDPVWRLYVNPIWLAAPERTVPEVGAELAHQVWHLLADHAGRASDLRVTGTTSRAWRVAADVTVHDVVRTLPGSDPGRPLGHGPLTRAAALGDHHVLVAASRIGLPPGRSAEEYYAILTGLPAHVDDPDHDPAWVPRDAEQEGPPPAGPDPSCGSGCDGLHRSYELPELSDAGGLSAVAAEGIRRTVAIEFRETRGRGDAPGEWDRWVARVLDPIVDWRNVLHAAVRRGLGWAHGHSDYTYTRISRRQASAGNVILPALRRPIPRVGIVVDTSGSVDDGLLAQALGEVDGVLATLGVSDPQVTVLAVDAAVQTISTVRRAHAVRLAGGGGTDMALGIRAVQELRPRVDVIIVLTDGCTGWPRVPAPVPVIAVLIGHTREDLPRTPDWVQRVECVR